MKCCLSVTWFFSTSSDTNNPLDANDIDECLRDNEKDEGNETDFSLHDTSADCLF
jgi:hypothetical protein